MFIPARGGARGGRDNFDWEEIKQSKDRELYLGNSLKASVGRWQKGRDIMWYTKDAQKEGEAKAEKDLVKMKEKEAMEQLLGLRLGKPLASLAVLPAAQSQPAPSQSEKVVAADKKALPNPKKATAPEPDPPKLLKPFGTDAASLSAAISHELSLELEKQQQSLKSEITRDEHPKSFGEEEDGKLRKRRHDIDDRETRKRDRYESNERERDRGGDRNRGRDRSRSRSRSRDRNGRDGHRYRDSRYSNSISSRDHGDDDRERNKRKPQHDDGHESRDSRPDEDRDYNRRRHHRQGEDRDNDYIKREDRLRSVRKDDRNKPPSSSNSSSRTTSLLKKEPSSDATADILPPRSSRHDTPSPASASAVSSSPRHHRRRSRSPRRA